MPLPGVKYILCGIELHSNLGFWRTKICYLLSWPDMITCYKIRPRSKERVFFPRRRRGNKRAMRIAIVGSGYVGLVTGACFADFGHQVVCVDKDAAKIAMLEKGEMPIYEPGLSELVQSNVREERLAFTTNLASAVRQAESIFIAVGTPSRGDDGQADLNFVYGAAEGIATAIENFAVVVNKSTVPVGTGDEVESIIRSRRPSADFSVVSNPEFLREGAAIYDFKHPDRIVIGSEDPRAHIMMHEIYRPLYLNAAPFLFTSRRTAELIKYASNAYLATKVTFINEMADLCENLGANVQDLARGIGLDNRIGPKFLHAGPGFGGSCFPKDTVALGHTARKAGVPSMIVEAVAKSNQVRKRSMAERVTVACGGDVRDKTIAILGLSFKQNTDDVREAPAIEIITALQMAGAKIRAYDPQAMEQARPILTDVIFCQNAYLCADGASALVIVTEWDAFRALDLARIRDAMREPVVVDLRNIYSPVDMRTRGFRYFSVGRQ
jgi:UDPglucose 6-dehydrogenase